MSIGQLQSPNLPQQPAQLKQSLIRAMQDPYYAESIGMTAYSAMAKLQKLVADEKAGANQQHMQGGAQPTVAQQLAAEAEPQPQGVATLPVPETMYAADGGIAGYEAGGEVKHYYSGNRVSADEQYALELDRAAKERALWYAKAKDAVLGVTGTPSSWQYSLTGGVLGAPYSPSAPEAQNAYNKQLELQSDKINRAKYADSLLPYGPMAGSTPGGITPLLDKAAQAPINAPAMPAVNMQVPVEKMNLPAPAPIANISASETARHSGVNPTQAPAPSTADGIKALQYQAPEDLSAELAALRTQPTSAEAAMEKWKGLVGIDPFQAKAADRLAAMEAKAQTDEQRAPWMALAEAGLNMAAGTSPFALQNIAAGGMKGIESLAKAKDKAAEAEQRRFTLEAELAKANRAEQVAAATYGANSEQADKAAERADKLAEFNYKAKRASDKATGTYEAQKDRLDLSQKQQQLDITKQHYNDWYKVSLASAEKSLQGIEKQGIQQQTALLNNALDEAVRQQKDALANMDDKTAAEAQGKIDAIQKRLFEITGVKYNFSTPAAPTGPRNKPLSSFG